MAWEDDAQPGVTDNVPTVYEAIFLDTALTDADALTVKIPAFDDGERAFDVAWMPRAGASGQELPTAGDTAVVIEAVALDGDATVWAVLCWTPS